MQTSSRSHLQVSKSKFDANKTNKLIDKKEKELKQCESDLYKLTDEIKFMTRNLHEKRGYDKSKRIAETMISTHNEKVAFDALKRSCDREFHTREYTKMDKDTWQYEDMRSWFNKYGSEQQAERFDPFSTGYRIRL